MSILEELNAHVEDINDVISEESLVINPVATVKINSPFNGNNFSINKSIADKLAMVVNLASVKRSIGSEVKIGKSIAVEVFTMIGEDSPVNAAKLTNNPSEANKEMLDNIIKDIPTQLSEDEVGSLTTLRNEINTLENDLNRVKEVAVHDIAILEEAHERLMGNKIVIMTTDQIFDFYRSDLLDLYYNGLSHSEYSFKVDVKELIKTIIDSESFKQYKEKNGLTELSLMSLVSRLIGDLRDLSGAVDRLFGHRSTIEKVLAADRNQVDNWAEDAEYLLKGMVEYSDQLATIRYYNELQEDNTSWYACLIALVVGLSE